MSAKCAFMRRAGTHLDDAEAHLEDVLAGGAELAALGVRPDRALEVSRAVEEAGEVAVAHLQAVIELESAPRLNARARLGRTLIDSLIKLVV